MVLLLVQKAAMLVPQLVALSVDWMVDDLKAVMKMVVPPLVASLPADWIVDEPRAVMMALLHHYFTYMYLYNRYYMVTYV